MFFAYYGKVKHQMVLTFALLFCNVGVSACSGSPMKKLLAYLNSLSPDQRNVFENATGTTIGYMRKAVSVNQRLGAEICVAIEQASHGVVTRKDLRPDDWASIWPELVDAA